MRKRILELKPKNGIVNIYGKKFQSSSDSTNETHVFLVTYEQDEKTIRKVQGTKTTDDTSNWIEWLPV